MTIPTAAQPQHAPRTELVAIDQKDIAEVASFIAAQSGRTAETIEAHLRWFLLQNPARQPQHPLGFGLRFSHRLVGCILCSPQTFQVETQTITLMGSSMFYIDQLHRGHGGRIFLQYCRLASRYPLFGTSANAEAAALWKAAGASPIPNSDCELFGVLRWPPIAEELAHRRYSSRLLSALAGTRISSIVGMFRPLQVHRAESDLLRPLVSAEQVNDLKLSEAPSQRAAKLTAARDLPYIRWRYFSGRDATAKVFAWRSRRLGQNVLVAVNHRDRGYRGQIKTLNVLDVYPGLAPEEWLQVIGALIAGYRNLVDAVVLRGQNPEQQKALCAGGFQRRTFDAPIGWFLDRFKLLPTHDWYSAPADGDALI